VAAIGITEFQLGIGATIYSSLVSIELPAPAAARIQHVCSNVTFWPTKSLGYVPATLAGEMFITGASVDEFVTAVLTGSAERKISFHFANAEHYVYAYSGDVTSIDRITRFKTSPHKYTVSFSFPLSRSKVYKASDDSVLWGS